MQHFGAVDVLEPPENLVDEVLHVLIRQRLWALDDLVEVGVHQLVDEVDVIELDFFFFFVKDFGDKFVDFSGCPSQF